MPKAHPIPLVHLDFRVEEPDRALLEAVAATQGRSVSDLTREVLHAWAEHVRGQLAGRTGAG